MNFNLSDYLIAAFGVSCVGWGIFSFNNRSYYSKYGFLVDLGQDHKYISVVLIVFGASIIYYIFLSKR